MEESKFLTSKAKKAFNSLKEAFTKVLIFQHFDPECDIRIETNASAYTIGEVINQLTLNQMTSDGIIRLNVDWYLVAYFSRKMISAETWYETHNSEFSAIVKVFKTWQHYLKDCKHEVLVLTDYNNLCQFMDTKSLSSKQVCWAQKLSHYYFQIDYGQGKANGAVDALSQYSQQNAGEEKTLCDENVKIFYRL